MRKLEAAMERLEDTVQTHAQDVVAIAAGFARPDERIFVQNTATAAVHRAKPHDDGHTMCGWRFSGARKRGADPPYRTVHSLASLPSSMICERCMPTEKAVAAMLSIVEDVDLSGDES